MVCGCSEERVGIALDTLDPDPDPVPEPEPVVLLDVLTPVAVASGGGEVELCAR